MRAPPLLDIRPHVADALMKGRPVVALESTLIAHGLPWPHNLQTAQAAEAAVRQAGAVPATVALLAGEPTVGLDAGELERLARTPGVRKASSRDLAACAVHKADAATTVAATMWLAHLAGIRVFATGGIGGVHPGGRYDVSADLVELGRTPVAVVCAGAKSILDLPATLEVLETHGVPVLGFGSDDFAAFYVRSSGLPVSARADTAGEVAEVLAAHWRLGGKGVVVSQPVAEGAGLAAGEVARLVGEAEEQARRERVHGGALTPFLLARLAELSGGRTLRVNEELIVANAGLAARIAGELCGR